jgi:hypothetical protein
LNAIISSTKQVDVTDSTSWTAQKEVVTMFFRRKIFFFAFLGLLFIGIGGMRQRSAFEMGYWRGYTAGEQASDGKLNDSAESGETTRQTPEAPYYRGHRHGFGFFKFVLLVLFAGMFMRRVGSRKHGWHNHRHGGGEPKEKQPEDVEPDLRAV